MFIRVQYTNSLGKDCERTIEAKEYSTELQDDGRFLYILRSDGDEMIYELPEPGRVNGRFAAYAMSEKGRTIETIWRAEPTITGSPDLND